MGQQVDVLVVDDSAFFRHRIIEILQQSPHINIVGTAVNGKDAVEKAAQLNPDIITMDVEMPVMDGIQAVREIMLSNPTPVLMFSNLTSEGARVTLDALDAGAVDYLSKNFSPSSTYDETYVVLREKVLNIALKTNRQQLKTVGSAPIPGQPQKKTVVASPANASKGNNDFDLLIIGASTGGPVALQNVLTSLPGNFPVPVIAMVHMPASFTTAYANRLNDLCNLSVREATDKDALKAGLVLLAPGGMQLLVNRGKVDIKESLPEQTYHPSVDVGFASAAESYGQKVLALVLTGMGADGKMGAQKLKQAGATVWSQNQESCVVYGMPQAVEKAGLSDRVLPLDVIGEQLTKAF
ncbi:MAG: chemotaxis response regulator protein-glutamate methylesterase [Gammaproteobacteria bacterium]|nr:chemotaxis response regulator protein-glutamate methylesterase [Gammaproteobacteria bacterium]